MTAEQRAGLYSDDFARSLSGFRAEDEVISVMRSAPARTGLDRAQYADLTFWLPGDILTKVDRTSMAVGLEAREPLLDHRLIEFAARMPDALRVRGATGKYLLKRAMETHLTHDILYRAKQGFVTPISTWLRGPLAQTIRALIKEGAVAQSGLFEPAVIARLVEDHIASRAENSRALWQLLMLEMAMARLGVSA